MSFIISITGKNQVNECDEYIQEEYFTFLNSYESNEENSLLTQTGNALGLNLQMLGNFSFDEYDEEENLGIQWINTKEAINTVDQFILKVKECPRFYESLVYENLSVGFMDQNEFGQYVNNQLVSDLETIRKILACYDSNRVDRVYFTFA